MDLARVKCFCDGFNKMFVNHKHKINFGNAPDTKNYSCHNQKTDTMAQLEKSSSSPCAVSVFVPLSFCHAVYLSVCLSVCLTVRA